MHDVPGVVNHPGPELEDESESAAAFRAVLTLRTDRGHTGDRDLVHVLAHAVVEAGEAVRITAEKLGCLHPDCFGNDDIHVGVDVEQSFQRVRIQVIPLKVAGRHELYEGQLGRFDRQLGHADQRMVGFRGLFTQCIGQIGVTQEMNALPLYEEPALSKPPDTQTAPRFGGGMDVLQQCLTLQNWLDHMRIRIQVEPRQRQTPSPSGGC